MPRHSLVDRAIYGTVAVLLLVLGVYLVVDSVKNEGFGFCLSFRMLALAGVTILSFLAVLRGRGGEEAADETPPEEL